MYYWKVTIIYIYALYKNKITDLLENKHPTEGELWSIMGLSSSVALTIYSRIVPVNNIPSDFLCWCVLHAFRHHVIPDGSYSIIIWLYILRDCTCLLAFSVISHIIKIIAGCLPSLKPIFQPIWLSSFKDAYSESDLITLIALHGSVARRDYKTDTNQSRGEVALSFNPGVWKRQRLRNDFVIVSILCLLAVKFKFRSHEKSRASQL